MKKESFPLYPPETRDKILSFITREALLLLIKQDGECSGPVWIHCRDCVGEDGNTFLHGTLKKDKSCEKVFGSVVGKYPTAKERKTIATEEFIRRYGEQELFLELI